MEHSTVRTAGFVLALTLSCGQEQLDFALPDSADASASASTAGHSGQSDAWAQGGAGTAPSEASKLGPAVGGYGGLGTTGGATGSSAQPSKSNAADPLFTIDPLGYDGAPENEPPWCALGQTFPEVCGNDLDEDCDHTVDELAELGQPCHEDCGEGTYGCDVTTHTVICRRPGCENPRSGVCGDGFLDVGEQCDTALPGEQVGVSCLEDCTRPVHEFVRCLDERGQAVPRRCAGSMEVCSEHVGACVPVTGPEHRLCPEIPLPGSTDPKAVYPTLEVIETGECWISCGEDADCPPSVLTDCYMGICVVPL
jgi:hypothetical protein